MPRSDSYLTDDEDDDTRRAAASGVGVPAWVWGVGGAVVFVVLLVGSFGFAFFNRRAEVREARDEAARAEAMQKTPAAMKAVPERPAYPLALLADAYKTAREKANAHYSGRQFRVQVRVTTVAEGWVGASADLGAGPPRDAVPNVIFYHAGRPVAPGELVVFEGTCAGLSPGPTGGAADGPTLIFTGCRLVGEAAKVDP